MLDLLAKIIPLDLAIIIGSPAILAIALLLLAEKYKPKIKTFAFMLGILTIGIGITLLGVSLGQVSPTDQEETMTSAIVDLVLGLVFVIFGIKVILSKERKAKKIADQKGLALWKIFLGGLVLTLTNTDAELFLFMAAKETVSDPDVNGLFKTIFLIMNLSFFILPVLLPLLFYLFFPKLAAKPLEKLNYYVKKYSKYILFAMFMLFGAFLLYRGMMFFIKLYA